MKRIALFAAVSTMIVSLMAVPALAGGGDPRIELDQHNPAYGDSVTFTLSNAKGSRADVRLVCGQDALHSWTSDPAARLVMDQTLPYYGDSTREFLLSSPGWTSGGNYCVAWLMRKGEALAGTLFWVTG